MLSYKKARSQYVLTSSAMRLFLRSRSSMQALFEVVRQDCSPGEWSRGVELSRGGAVIVEHATRDEVMLRIATRSGMMSPTVTLWPEDKDWSCNCSSQAEVCAHVAAAVIALRHAPQAGPDSHGSPSQRPTAA